LSLSHFFRSVCDVFSMPAPYRIIFFAASATFRLQAFQ
jgi:hypothetical protein